MVLRPEGAIANSQAKSVEVEWYEQEGVLLKVPAQPETALLSTDPTNPADLTLIRHLIPPNPVNQHDT